MPSVSKGMHNLGYFVKDDAPANGVRSFQKDYGLPATGTLDQVTCAKLAVVHDGGIAASEG